MQSTGSDITSNLKIGQSVQRHCTHTKPIINGLHFAVIRKDLNLAQKITYQFLKIEIVINSGNKPLF